MAEPDGAGEITGPCGDTMEFYLKVKDGIIEQINFYTDGCGTTIACGSMTTKLVKGKGVRKAIELTGQDIIEALDGLPEESLHCAKLAADALQKAIRDYLDRKEG
jgi:nitrogen fixation NifU-like protein